MDAPSEIERRLLRGMIRIRSVEQTIADLYPQGGMRTPTHFSIGQEAVAIGVCVRGPLRGRRGL